MQMVTAIWMESFNSWIMSRRWEWMRCGYRRFFPSPLKDFGYDISDHRAVDPRMGNLATFDRLLAETHRRGLKLIVDLVCGHTSDHHPWFGESRRAKQGSRADWYVWADPAADGTAPNNWLSVFGGPAWTWEPRRRQYYLHHFLASQPTLDLRNPAVVAELLDTAATRAMQFCHGDLRLPCRAWVPATYGNGSVEVTSVIDGGRPDAVWFAACRARRNPRSTPPAGAAL